MLSLFYNNRIRQTLDVLWAHLALFANGFPVEGQNGSASALSRKAPHTHMRCGQSKAGRRLQLQLAL